MKNYGHRNCCGFLAIRIVRDAEKYLSSLGHLVNDYWLSILIELGWCCCYCHFPPLVRRGREIPGCLSFQELSIPRKNAVCVESDDCLLVEAINSELRRRSSITSLCSASASTDEDASVSIAMGDSAGEIADLFSFVEFLNDVSRFYILAC